MADQAMADLLAIRQNQEKVEQERIDRVVQESKDSFQRRLDNAKLDSTLNLPEDEEENE